MTSRTKEKINDAVEYAIDSGESVSEFIREARECWSEYLTEKQARDDRAFAKAEKP